MQSKHTKRLFIAISIKSDIALENLIKLLNRQLAHERINWVNLNNLHLTIKFLGETPTDMVLPISKALQAVTQQYKPFDYMLDKCGLFGSRYDPRVIWLGADSHPESMIQLGNQVIDAMHTLGFERDRQNFVPHLTIGRIKFLNDKKRFHEIFNSINKSDYQRLMVSNIKLYESQLKPSGPVYAVLGEFMLSL